MKIDDSILEGAKILIVDDIAENVKLLGKVLQSKKVKISIANNGLKGVETAKTIKPDLILMDVNMPEMDGFEATEKIMEIGELDEIPVLFLTALADVNDIIEGFDKGGVDYITKPFNHKVLISRIKTHLHIKFQREKLLKLNNDLKRLDLEKTKFLSIVSHDLRSPLNGLIGLTEILHKEYDSLDESDIKEFISTIFSALKNQYNFMENMLKWGNLQFNRVKMEFAQIFIKELVVSIFGILEVNASNKDITLEHNINFESLKADQNLLQLIIQNLTSNSIKYTNEGGKIIVHGKEEEDHYHFTVEDNGIGMPESISSKLFRIDEVISAPGTNNESGTGLGLIVTLESVNKHKGKIWVESEQGVGSKFHFTVKKGL